jgi:hypothetical protein
MFVSEDIGAANNVVAINQATIDHAPIETAAPVELSSKRIGDQLKMLRIRFPIKLPNALPNPIPRKSDVALSAVRVSDDAVEAPVTISINDRANQAPANNPTSESVLTINPRRQPEINIKIPNASKIMSK